VSIPRGARRAAARYGALVDPVARNYRNPYTGHPLTGEQLLLKLSKGEAGFAFGRTSSAGAKGPTQFTAGSRKVAIDKFGIDPWRSYDEAFHGAALHLLGEINGRRGLSGYNPGDASYPGYILKQKIGPIRETRGAQTAAGGTSAGGVVDAAGPSAQPGQDLTSALIGALTGPQQRQVSAPPMPSFAAKATLPAGYQPQQPSSPPVKSDRSALLSLLSQAAPTLSGGVQQQEQSPAAGGGSTSAGRIGRVVIAAGAERPGIGLAKSTLGFLHRIAGISGRTITVGTGTRHSKYTVDGNVSDHWDGHAADLPVPVDSRQGDLVAAHALQAAGVPWGRAIQMARRGGLYTLEHDGHRVQVIWKTNQGGNHHNHVHVGYR
jgi:hypothetical protein